MSDVQGQKVAVRGQWAEVQGGEQRQRAEGSERPLTGQRTPAASNLYALPYTCPRVVDLRFFYLFVWRASLSGV